MKVEELSDYVGINRSYFSDLFKQYTGMSPVKYLQNFRITKAQHMLTISELSIESIAFSCGDRLASVALVQDQQVLWCLWRENCS